MPYHIECHIKCHVSFSILPRQLANQPTNHNLVPSAEATPALSSLHAASNVSWACTVRGQLCGINRVCWGCAMCMCIHPSVHALLLFICFHCGLSVCCLLILS